METTPTTASAVGQVLRRDPTLRRLLDAEPAPIRVTAAGEHATRIGVHVDTPLVWCDDPALLQKAQLVLRDNGYLSSSRGRFAIVTGKGIGRATRNGHHPNCEFGKEVRGPGGRTREWDECSCARRRRR